MRPVKDYETKRTRAHTSHSSVGLRARASSTRRRRAAPLKIPSPLRDPPPNDRSRPSRMHRLQSLVHVRWTRGTREPGCGGRGCGRRRRRRRRRRDRRRRRRVRPSVTPTDGARASILRRHRPPSPSSSPSSIARSIARRHHASPSPSPPATTRRDATTTSSSTTSSALFFPMCPPRRASPPPRVTPPAREPRPPRTRRPRPRHPRRITRSSDRAIGDGIGRRARASVRAVVRSSIGARAFFIESTSRARTHHRFLRACVRVTTSVDETDDETDDDAIRAREGRPTDRPTDRPRGCGQHAHTHTRTHTHGTKDTSNTMETPHDRSPSWSDAWKPYPPRAAIFSHARFFDALDDVGRVRSVPVVRPTRVLFFVCVRACAWFSSRSIECLCRV